MIIAKKYITVGDEIAYDYQFAFEEDKIICNCGSHNCRGVMN